MPQEALTSAPPIEGWSVVLPPKRYASPLRLLVIIAASVFVVEALVMILLIILPPLPHTVAAPLDALLVTLLMYPILYRFVVRPMTRHINERRQAEAALSRAYDEMESRVRERTAELAQANTSLQTEIAERQLASAELQVALEASQQRQAEVVSLLKGARAVLEYRDFEEVAQAILKTCQEVIGATAGYAALPSEDRSNEKIVLLNSGNSAPVTDRELQVPIRGLRAQVYSTGKPVCVNDYASSEWTETLPGAHAGLKNIILAPMVIRGFVVGLICLADKPGGFSDSDVRLTTAFAELAAISLLNSRTLELVENSEKRFRTLAQASFEGIAISENGVIHEVNEQFAQTYGYKLSDIIGRPVTDFLATEQHAQVMRTVTGSEDYIGEYRALRKDGSTVFLEAHGRTIEQGGRAVRVTAMRDITERKRSEEALRRQSEELKMAWAQADNDKRRLEAVMEALPIGVAITDVKGGSLLVNNAYNQVWRGPRPVPHSVDEYDAYRAWWSDTGQAVAPEEWASAQAVQKGEPVVGQLMKIQRFDGSQAYVINSASPVRNANGEMIGSAVAIQDITDLHRIGQALRESEGRLRALYVSMTEGLANHEVVYVNGKAVDYIITDVNPAFERITGLARSETVGRQASELYGTGSPPYLEVYAKVASGEAPEDFETYFPPLDKHFAISVFSPEKGKFATVFTDITERRRAENLLRAQHGLLLAVTETRTLPETLRLCLAAALDVSGMDGGGIYLTDNDGSMHLAQATGVSGDFMAAVRHYPPDAPNTRLVQAGEPVYTQLSDLDMNLSEAERREALRAFAVIPIRHEQRIIGCLNVASRTLDEVPTHGRVSLETIASTMGLLISGAQTQAALRESEERLRRVARAGQIGLYEWNTWEDNAYWSPEAYELFGREPGSPTGFEGWLACLHPDDREPAAHRLTEMLEQTRTGLASSVLLQDEYRVVHRDGSVLWLEATTSFELDGNDLAMRGAVRNVTERKRADEQMRLQSAALEAAAHAVLITNSDGVIQWANPAFTRLTGYTAAEAIERTPRVLKSGRHDQAFYQAMWQTISAGKVWHGEVINKRKDGTLYSEDMTITPVVDAGGAVTHFIAIKQDITERKQAEQALRQSREDLARAQDVGQIGSWRLDVRHNVLTWSDENHRIFGVPQGTPMTYETFLESIHPDDREYVDRKWKAGLAGEPYDIEHRIVADGQVKWVREKAYLEFDAAGELFGGFGITQDITERKQAEERMSWLASFPELNPVPVMEVDLAGHVEYLNSAARLWLPDPEMMGPTHPWLADLESVSQRFQSESETVMTREVQLNEAVYQQTLSYVPGRQRLRIYCLDISKRKRAEEALRQAHAELELRVQERTQQLAKANEKLLAEIDERKAIERQLRLRTTAMEAAANGILITDRQGNIQWNNPAFTQMTGYTSEEALGQNIRLLKSNEQPPEFYRRLWETILSGSVWQGELVNRRKDSSLYVEEQTIAPVLDEHGEIVNFISVKQDVTERRRAEARLRQNNRDLMALSKAERDQRQLAETLVAANLALTQTLNLEAVLETLLDYVGQLVPYDSANVMLLEDEARLSVRVARGYERWNNADALRVRAITFDGRASPVFSPLLTTRQSQLVSDTRAQPGWEVRPGIEHVHSWLGVPLMAGGNVIGLYSLDKTEPGYFTSEHVRMAEMLAGQAAVAIQNAWLFEQVRAGRERLQSLSRRLVEVQEAERQYVARELHDEAGQALTSLLFGLGQIEPQQDNPQQAAQITDLKEIANGIIENLHRLAMDLRPASLDHLGLVPALIQHVKAIGDRYGLRAQFKAVGLDHERLLSEVETALYRIVQEALTNIVRHARATRVDVILERRGDQVVVVVEDNGLGFDAASPRFTREGHFGLAGMQERAEMLGGSLIVESTAGTGTTVVVEVPYGNTHSDR